MNSSIQNIDILRSGYVDAILRYFYNPTDQLEVILETKIESFCTEFEDPHLAYTQIKAVIEKLQRNDFKTWGELQKEVISVFKNDTEMNILFLTITEKRNIPSMKWTS